MITLLLIVWTFASIAYFFHNLGKKFRQLTHMMKAVEFVMMLPVLVIIHVVTKTKKLLLESHEKD